MVIFICYLIFHSLGRGDAHTALYRHPEASRHDSGHVRTPPMAAVPFLLATGPMCHVLLVITPKDITTSVPPVDTWVGGGQEACPLPPVAATQGHGAGIRRASQGQRGGPRTRCRETEGGRTIQEPLVHALLSHRTSLSKHKFKDKTIG